MFTNFKLSKYTFNLIAHEDMMLPTNKASTLRGGFGNIFKKLNCINKQRKKCISCPVQNTCAYAYVFETSEYSQKPRPYIIEVPFNDKRNYKKGETIKFKIVLLGKATNYLPHFIFSFIELGKKGLTKNNYKFTLDKVFDIDNKLIFADNQIIEKGRILTWQDIIDNTKLNIQDKLTLNFVTPLRISYYKKLVSDITFELLMKKLTKRINDIYKYHCETSNQIDYKELIKNAKNIEVSFNNLKWKDWTRYSNRQKKTMLFGGLLGNITFKGNFEEFLPYLLLGSFIHVGKNCTFGQGKYEII